MFSPITTTRPLTSDEHKQSYSLLNLCMAFVFVVMAMVVLWN